MEAILNKKRLFITTGLISLINALTIIEQQSEEQCEDTLIVVSFNQNEEFIKTQTRIASLHNFKQIIFYKKEKELIKNINFEQYNAVYCITFYKLTKLFSKLTNCYIFDEGPGYAIFNVQRLKNLSGFYITNFLEKFSFIDAPAQIPVKFINIDVFNSIAEKVLKEFGESSILPTSRNVLFIGHYVYRKLGDDFAEAFYKKYIDYFIALGYNVYFKAHPRDNDVILPILKETYKNNPSFKILENKLPIEIYNYDFDLVIGAYSGMLVSLPHYRKIPSLNLPMKELYHTDVGMNFKKFFALYDEYTPSFDEMKFVLDKSKQEIWNHYEHILQTKEKLNDNKLLKQILLYKSNVFDTVFLKRRKFYKLLKNYMS